MMKCEAFDGVNVELLLASGFWPLAVADHRRPFPNPSLRFRIRGMRKPQSPEEQEGCQWPVASSQYLNLKSLNNINNEEKTHYRHDDIMYNGSRLR